MFVSHVNVQQRSHPQRCRHPQDIIPLLRILVGVCLRPARVTTMMGMAAALLSQTGPPSTFATPEHAFCRLRTTGQHRTQPQQQATKTRAATALAGAMDLVTVGKQSRVRRGRGPACTATCRDEVDRRRRRPTESNHGEGKRGRWSGEALAGGQGTRTVRADPPPPRQVVTFTEVPTPPLLRSHSLLSSAVGIAGIVISPTRCDRASRCG